MAVPPVARSTPPTRKELLVTLARPETEALSCLLVPASLHWTVVKAAMPLPAAEPMSRLVVPSKEPEPEASDKVRFALTGKPTAEILPKASSCI